MIDATQDVKPSAESTSDSVESTDIQQETVEDTDSQDENNEEIVIDYEAELTKEKEKRLRAQETAKFERERRKKSEGKEDTETDDEDDKTAKIVDERVQKILREQRQDLIDETLDGLTDNKGERQLIEDIYDNKLNPSAFGFTRKGISEALETAKLIANLPRFKAQLIKQAKVEAKKELQQESDMTSASGGASTRRQPKATQSYNAEERRLLDFSKKAADRIRRK